jgi:type II secretion system protein N
MKEQLLKFWNERLAKYTKYAGIVGYPLFYLLCLSVFASLTFPYDKLKERIVYSFNEDQKGPAAQELQIADMSGYWLTGVRMKGVNLLSPPSEPGKPPSKITIDDATVRYAMLPMLFGGRHLNFSADAFGGNVDGSFVQDGNDKSLDLTIDSIDLGQVQPLVGLLGVPIEGKLGGTAHIRMPDGKASKGSGAVSLEAKGTAVGDGKAKLKGAIALTRLDVGTITFAAEAKDGVLKISKFLAGGKDIELQGDGRITMRELFVDALCDVQVRFRINDGYRSKNDMTKSLFGAPGSSAPALFDLADPKVKQAKRPDGFYSWSVRGPIGRLDFFPSGK